MGTALPYSGNQPDFGQNTEFKFKVFLGHHAHRKGKVGGGNNSGIFLVFIQGVARTESRSDEKVVSGMRSAYSSYPVVVQINYFYTRICRTAVSQFINIRIDSERIAYVAFGGLVDTEAESSGRVEETGIEITCGCVDLKGKQRNGNQKLNPGFHGRF